MAKIKVSALHPTPAEDINRMRALMVQPGSEEFVAAQKQRKKLSPIPSDQRRYFRNMQRQVVRDISNTEKAISKAADPTVVSNLTYRLEALKDIRHAMLQSWVDAQGHRHYNTALGRMEALNTYVGGYKGAAALKEQAARVRRLSLSEGSREFYLRAANLVGYTDDDSPFDTTPMYEELMQDLDRALRTYDSGQAKYVMAKIMHGREAYEHSRRQRMML